MVRGSRLCICWVLAHHLGEWLSPHPHETGLCKKSHKVEKQRITYLRWILSSLPCGTWADLWSFIFLPGSFHLDGDAVSLQWYRIHVGSLTSSAAQSHKRGDIFCIACFQVGVAVLFSHNHIGKHFSQRVTPTASLQNASWHKIPKKT